MRRLRILQIFNRYLNYGGEEGSVYRIGDALQKLHDVEYFLSSSHDFISGGLFARLQLPLKAFYNYEVVNRLKRYQSLGRFEIWQIHNIFPVMSPAVYDLSFKLGIPVVHYLHNYRLSCVNGFFLNHGKICQRCLDGNFWPAFTTKCWHESHLQSGYMGMIVHQIRRKGLFEKIARWVAISEAQKIQHVRMGIPADKIDVVHHFYHLPEPPPPPSPAGHALFVGRLSVEKGVMELLEAWRTLDCKEKKLYIVGDGPERGRLTRHVEQLNMQNVIFTGFLHAYQQSALWENTLFSIVPSIWHEPFGMTILEAWGKGRPVIGSRLGALPELIEHGKTGLTVDVFNPVELAQAMKELFDAPGRAVEMGLEGRRVLDERFTRSVWLEKMSKVYTFLA